MVALDMKVPAPELSDVGAWLNVAAPLSLASLRGKIVLLDFWTFCCSDCMHILPYLKKLEESYAQELVVIGIHSAKFDNEKDWQNIKNAVLRYNIVHPVACDSKFALWEKYWIREWPTLVLIDPEGFIVKKVACSQGPFGQFEAAIEELIEEHDARGTLSRVSVPIALESSMQVDGYLRYPGKITASESLELLFVADSGHNRILILSADGEIKDVIGSGSIGAADGDYKNCQFNSPQGLCLVDRILYVADTENHLLRAIDLEKRQVATVAGNGKQLLYAGGINSGPAAEMALSSPWDICQYEDLLFIAMAGAHQIWSYDPKSGFMEIFAGSGKESLKDDKRLESQLSQPSGITRGDRRLYFVDSETSSVRFIEMGTEQAVKTIVGTGLFDFGDCDGEKSQVKLQHPLGIVFDRGKLFVADSYNHRIKMIDPLNSSSKSIAGHGKPGYGDGLPGALWEPGGITHFAGKLYIADTNNHAIRSLDLDGGELKTVSVHSSMSQTLPNCSSVHMPEHSFAPGCRAEIILALVLQQGLHLNQDMPVLLEIRQSGELLQFAKSVALKEEIRTFPLSIPFECRSVCSREDLVVELMAYYCSADSACFVKSFRFEIPIIIAAGSSASKIEISAVI